MTYRCRWCCHWWWGYSRVYPLVALIMAQTTLFHKTAEWIFGLGAGICLPTDMLHPHGSTFLIGLLVCTLFYVSCFDSLYTHLLFLDCLRFLAVGFGYLRLIFFIHPKLSGMVNPNWGTFFCLSNTLFNLSLVAETSPHKVVLWSKRLPSGKLT